MFALVLKTLGHFHRQLLPVVLGVAVAGAIITGALIVGDSVRGSLRSIAMDRIGRIDRILLSPRWFSPKQVLPQPSGGEETDLGQLQSLLYLPQATASFDIGNSDNRAIHRANEMALLGVSDAFWRLGSLQPKRHPAGEQVILNQTLADALQATVGSKITLRVAANALVPAESVLGKRDADTFVLPRWEVIEILPDESLSRFSLRSDQRPVMNAFADISAMQSALSIDEQVNALVLTTDFKANRSTPTILSRLSTSPHELGFQFERVTIPENGQAAQASSEGLDGAPKDYLQYDHITTDQMLMSDRVEKTLLQATQPFKPQPILTYLANGVEKVESAPSESAPSGNVKSVPYSTISGVEWSLLSKLLESTGGEAAEVVPQPGNEDWVVVNRWLADELQLMVGDRVKIDYFLPETVEGVEIEKAFEATVVGIAPLTTPSAPYRRNRVATFDSPPTPFNDPHWTPTVPGITDQDSISNWETPFPLKRTISDKDDEYWNFHRLTPKLFISYELSKKLFGSRFGNTTSLRFDSLSESDRLALNPIVERTLQDQMADLGWREIPLRDQQLARSGGSTPFDALFMALSFFVIAAALLLVLLLFRLSIEKRAAHWGLMAAAGWPRNKIRSVLLTEGAILSSVGSFLGLLLGTGYAYAMLTLLRSWWIGAISVSFLDYHLTPTSMLVGAAASFLSSMAAIYLATRRLNRVEIASLLHGRVDSDRPTVSPKSWLLLACILFLFIGLACLGFGQGVQGQEQAMCFVGGGMSLMVSGLLCVWRSLTSSGSSTRTLRSFYDLAKSGIQRSPTRTILAIAMIAMASFLILSLSLFRASPTTLGTGGFTWVGKSSSPVYIELDSPEARREHLGPDADTLSSLQIASLRVRGGDDASCNNLYQANEPQVWGISPRIVEIDKDEQGKSRFAWFQRGSSEISPWTPLLEIGDGSKGAPVPVILDQNTALWALHLGGYVGEEFSYDFDGVPVHFRTVGVLQNTILQGGLIIGEGSFQKLFPTITGYRSFLIHAGVAGDQVVSPKQDSLAGIKMILENGWEEQGLSLAWSDSILEQLLAVQNTYLAAFQLLGSLGLMLGTLGLAVTQLRSAYERQAELASMRAVGFSRERITRLLALEATWQLLLGLGIGGGAALIATLPALLSGQPFAGFESPAWMLLGILLVGILTSWIAAKLAMRMPLLASLRSDT